MYANSQLSDSEDMDQETLTSMFLAKVRAEEAAGGSYGKLTGLASPEYSRYTPKAGLSTRNVQRLSLTSTSSDGSTSPWRAPAFTSPSLKSSSSRTSSCLYSISLVDDDLSSSLSPLDSTLSKNARWASNSPHGASSGSSYPQGTLNSWSTTMVSTPPGSSSSENTQTLSWTNSPFKFTPQSSAQKENHLPNTLATVYTPKTPGPAGLTERFAQHSSQASTPSFAPQSPLSVGPSEETIGDLRSSPHISGLQQAQVAADAFNDACLVDLDGSFNVRTTSPTDSNGAKVVTDTQREFESLTQGFNTFSMASSFPTVESPESSAELDSSLSETTISNLKPFYQAKLESTKPTSKRISLVGVPASVPSTTSLSNQQPIASKVSTDSLTEMVRLLTSVLCDAANTSKDAPCLKPIRPIFTFEDLLALVLGSASYDTSQQELVDDALIELMESGDAEALDLQEGEDNSSVTRLYRASAERFVQALTVSH